MEYYEATSWGALSRDELNFVANETYQAYVAGALFHSSIPLTTEEIRKQAMEYVKKKTNNEININ